LVMLCVPWVLGAGVSSAFQDTLDRARAAFQRAQSAYLAKQYEAYRQSLKEAVALRPHQPTYLYNLAGAEALAGHPGEALKWLERVARMGMVVPAASDADFSSLRGSSGFEKVLERIRRNERPVGGGRPLFRVHEKGLIAEGLARDPASGDFFLGSVRQRKILRIDGRTFQVRDFSSASDGLLGVFGMKVDAARGVLWACSSALAEMEGYRKEDGGRAGVFAYDVKTGRLIGKHFPPSGSEARVFGDLAVDSAGDVFVTDSLSAGLWILRAGADSLERFLVPGPFSSPQGLDLSADGKSLFVADYAWGIFRVDRSTRAAILLGTPEDVTLLGIDGLYRSAGGLLAIQNGTQPNRVISIKLDAGGARAKSLSVIEASTELLPGPTLGVLEGARFYVMANSEWDAFDPARGEMDASKTRFPAILRVEISERF